MLYWGKIFMATKFSCAENPRRVSAEATNKKDESKEASLRLEKQLGQEKGSFIEE